MLIGLAWGLIAADKLYDRRPRQTPRPPQHASTQA
jgi:hypothetical protein